MKINQAGINLIKHFEGVKYIVYLDVGGLPTVGYGHMDKRMHVGDVRSAAQVEAYFESDLDTIERSLNLICPPMKECQFSALVCLAFNIGTQALAASTLLAKLKAGDAQGAAYEFLKWDHVQGVVIPGLVVRRQAERELFLSNA